MAKTTSDDVIEAAIEKIASTFKDDGPSYADLSGNVYTKQQYLHRLRTDPEFAAQQLPALIQPPDAEDNGITPREQQNVARRFLKFAEHRSPDVTEFLRANRGLAESYSVGDLKRVIQTLRFEWGVDPPLPEQLKDADDEAPLLAAMGQ